MFTGAAGAGQRAVALAAGLAGLLALGLPAAAQGVQIGPSGLALPRFASVKSQPVNIRIGPSRDYDIAWTFTKAGVPVEITQEFDIWLRVRDSEGQEGWVQKSFLTGNKRMALVAPWEKGTTTPLLSRPGSPTVLARIEPNVLVEVEKCDGAQCRIAVDRYNGWVDQSRLWGVYQAEKYPNN
jgi:SH3-like domain-containing protein